MTAAIAVLGGSTPFVLPLVSALATDRIAPRELVLYGRNRDNLELVAGRAREILRDWRVRATQRLDEALDGAGIVVHQIRYGDLAGREADERLAVRFGAPPDESLGPSGLAATMRMRRDLIACGQAIVRWAPGTHVLNMTNPLGASTTLFHFAGVQRCTGICELPLRTLDEACTALGVDVSAVSWSYTGVNHRGFVHSIRADGEDILSGVNDAVIAGFSGERIRSLRAIPLPYVRLYTGGAKVKRGRAAYLQALRRRALKELRTGAAASSVAERGGVWYQVAVVPFIEELEHRSGKTVVVNLYSAAAGHTVERRARIDDGEVRPFERDHAPSEEVAQWVERFEEHERAITSALAHPSLAALEETCSLDPLLDLKYATDVAREIWQREESGPC